MAVRLGYLLSAILCSRLAHPMSIKIGINLMVWSGQIGTRELRLLPTIAAMGYDGVELPIFDAANVNVTAIRTALSDGGLQCTVSTALPDGLNLIDDEVARQSVDWLSNIIRVAAALGSSVVCGPMAAPVGELRGRGFTPAEWTSCVRCAVGVRAAQPL
jgi:D-psicose/D-tagatose/L-ribulose 3-epimerase